MPRRTRGLGGDMVSTAWRPTVAPSFGRHPRAQSDHPSATRGRLVIAAIAVVDPHRTDVLAVEQVRAPRIAAPLQPERLETALGGQVEYRAARGSFIGTVVHVHAIDEATVEDDGGVCTEPPEPLGPSRRVRTHRGALPLLI